MISVKNIVFTWGGFIGSVIYGFFMTPLIVRSLGDTSYGLWNLVATCFGYMALLDFGIQTAVNRYVAKYRGQADQTGINGIYTNAFALYSCIGFVAAIVGIVLALNVERIFVIPISEAPTVRTVMLIMAFYTALEFPANVYGSILYAHQRFDLLNGGAAAALCVQAACLLIVFRYAADLLGFSATIVACGLAKYTFQVVMSHRIAPGLSLKIALVSPSTLKMMAKFSAVSFLTMLTGYLMLKSDNIVIGMYLPPQAITIYSIGFMLSEYSFEIVNSMSKTFTPIFSDFESRGESDRIKSLVYVACRASVAIGVPLISVAIVVGKDFIGLWMGPGYEESYRIMVILMAGRALGFANRPLISMLYGIGKHYLGLYTAVCEACLKLGLSVILIRKLGVEGVAFGTAIPMVLGGLIFPFIVCRGIGIEFRGWLKEVAVRSGIFCICFVSTIWGISWFFRGSTWMGLFLEVGAFVVAYIAWAMAVAMRSQERTDMVRTVTVKLQPLQSRVKRWTHAETE